MDHKEAHHLRLYVLAALFFIVAAVYIGVLYDTQVNNYDYYYASSVRSIARSETVEAARGDILDRYGRVLVSNEVVYQVTLDTSLMVLVSSRSSYNLTFDASLLEKDEDANESLLRLLQLCQSRGINWVDSLPISRSAPFAYTIDSLDSAARSRFLTYLKDLDEAANALAAYLLEHPALLETTDEEGNRENPADDILADEELDQAGKAQALLEELTSSQLTGAMLEGSGLSATRLIALMRKDFGLSASFSVEEARLVLGVQYEIRSRNLARTDAYVLAEDIDAELISLLNDGDYAGAKITPSSVREYETTYGAHILGYLGKINDSAEKEALGEGYNWNDYVGKDGVEALIGGAEQILGYRVDSYALFDVEVFVELIDAMGGIDFDVPVDMDYDDPGQDLSIHVQKGYQHLNGYQTMGVFRFRNTYANGDIGRIDVQHQLLKAMTSQFLKLHNIPNLNKLIDIYEKDVTTNLSAGNVMFYVKEFLKLDESAISFETIPANYSGTKNGMSYVFIHVDEWLDYLNTWLNPYTKEITSADVDILYESNGQVVATSGTVQGPNKW